MSYSNYIECPHCGAQTSRHRPQCTHCGKEIPPEYAAYNEAEDDLEMVPERNGFITFWLWLCINHTENN